MSFFVDQLRRLGLPLATVGLAACGGDEPPPANAGQPAAGPSAPAVRFVDATAGSGLDGFVQVNGRPDKPTIVESFGGGVALVDVDGDGDLDLLIGLGNDGVIKFYLNIGTRTMASFQEQAETTNPFQLGFTFADGGHHTTFADYDGDGAPHCPFSLCPIQCLR